MRATAIVITGAEPQMGAAGGDLDDRLRHLGDRLRLRGGDRRRTLPAAATPDGRPGCRVLIFAMSTDELQKQLQNRVGQCVLTIARQRLLRRPRSATNELKLGAALRYFGDGWQISKKLGGRHFWRIPVMDGEFLCEATTGMTKEAVGGGNLLLLAKTSAQARSPPPRRRSRRSTRSPGAIMPFPGGIVALGLQDRRQIQGHDRLDQRCLRADADAGVTKSALSPDINAVLEIVIDGETSERSRPMRCRPASRAVAGLGPTRGAMRISAGNYGGKLGKFHYHLKELMP